MKKIGFIDFYISEWHANNYPAWIKEISDKTGDGFTVAYAWAEQDVSPVDGRTTDEWCHEFGVTKCKSIHELCEKSDYILILAPSNPEKHLGYAKEALKYGKRTYIDKTFAPSYAEAKQIFDVSDEYGTPFFSSSALRYADELKNIKASSVITTGGGGNYEEYIIHQIEMAVKLLGACDGRVKVEKCGNEYISQIVFENGTEAALIYGCAYPFSVHLSKENGGAAHLPVNSHFFNNLIEDILHFYNTGEKSFDGEETLCVMRIREALINAKEDLGKWIEMQKS